MATMKKTTQLKPLGAGSDKAVKLKKKSMVLKKMNLDKTAKKK